MDHRTIGAPTEADETEEPIEDSPNPEGSHPGGDVGVPHDLRPKASAARACELLANTWPHVDAVVWW